MNRVRRLFRLLPAPAGGAAGDGPRFRRAGRRRARVRAPAPAARFRLEVPPRQRMGNRPEPGQVGYGHRAGHVGFGDASWRSVDLPHDWAVELPFDRRADAAHGFKAVGGAFPQNSVAWYRRTFDLPAADAGKRLWLEFDGVYRDATVFVNGWFVGHHESGYSGFRYDITDVAELRRPQRRRRPGRRLAERRLVLRGRGDLPAHLAREDGVRSPSPPTASSCYGAFKGNVPAVPPRSRWRPASPTPQAAPADARSCGHILGPDGRDVATIRQTRPWPGRRPSSGRLRRRDRPRALVAGEPAPLPAGHHRRPAPATSSTGSRRRSASARSASTPSRGFLLNGRPYVLQGTCNHQDHAGVGSALPDALQSSASRG